MEYDESNIRKLTVSDIMTLSPRGMFERMHVLLAEIDRLRSDRDKNPGVWDGSPDNARYAVVGWYEDSGRDRPLLKDTYHCRTLPKTKAREIAERTGREFPSNDGFITMDRKTLAEVVHNAINEALAGGEK